MRELALLGSIQLVADAATRSTLARQRSARRGSGRRRAAIPQHRSLHAGLVRVCVASFGVAQVFKQSVDYRQPIRKKRNNDDRQEIAVLSPVRGRAALT